MQGLLRHITACDNAHLPGDRVAFRIGPAQVGWVRPDFAAVLAGSPEFRRDPGGIALAAEAAAFPLIVRRLAEAGRFRWRGEAFDVRAVPDGPVVTQVDRGALPAFGIMAAGVHVNGLVHTADGVRVWIGRRAADKTLDPGKLDHIVAGGVPAGLTAMQTLVKEAAEEAAIPADLASQAVEVGRLAYAMERPEGLRRDVLTCYDLYLPEHFVPRPTDGEVEGFELWPIDRVLERVRDGDDFKFNVNLVLIDLFLRLGLILGGEAGPLGSALRQLRLARAIAQRGDARQLQ